MKSDFYARFIGKPSLLILLVLLALHFLATEAKKRTQSPDVKSSNLRKNQLPSTGMNIGETDHPKFRSLRSHTRRREFLDSWLLPLDTGDRTNWHSIAFESDAYFMASRRNSYNNQPRLHTGIDMQNGGEAGTRGGPGELVYSMGPGIVLGTFDRLPNRRVVIEHTFENAPKVWTAYVHINESLVSPGEWVDAYSPIARRMNRQELRRYGEQYNHVHIEVMKKLPPIVNGQYQWMTFHCYAPKQVQEYFYNPKTFLLEHFDKNNF